MSVVLLYHHTWNITYKRYEKLEKEWLKKRNLFINIENLKSSHGI
jgi:hypothetical protein